MYFIHFDEPSITDEFISWTTNPIGDKCCNGKGVRIYDIDSHFELNRIRRIFLKLRNSNKQLCEICCELSVLKTLDCKHSFCEICIDKIILSQNIESRCPLCRTHLK